jgi:hypothetical protein
MGEDESENFLKYLKEQLGKSSEAFFLWTARELLPMIVDTAAEVYHYPILFQRQRRECSFIANKLELTPFHLNLL